MCNKVMLNHRANGGVLHGGGQRKRKTVLLNRKKKGGNSHPFFVIGETAGESGQRKRRGDKERGRHPDGGKTCPPDV